MRVTESKAVKLVVALLICVVAMFALAGCGESTEEEAFVFAKHCVEAQLKSPSSAKFCSFSEASVHEGTDNQWIVSGYVDADNSFGAKIREDWTVTFEKGSDGEFTNEYVTFDSDDDEDYDE